MENIAQQKKVLRSQIKQELKIFFQNQSNVEKAVHKASTNFLESDFYKTTDVLMAFISFQYEVDTSAIIKKAMEDRKEIFVPKVLPNSQMEFYFFDKNIPIQNQMTQNEWGIWEPNTSQSIFNPDAYSTKNIVMLVPGLLFTKDGIRMGRGKGFYDRYFEKFCPKNRCALCFDLQIKDSIPFDELDKKVTHIATEKELINCKI